MQKLMKRLKNGEILVSDGGIGTMLMENGLKPGDSPESFNLTCLDLVEKIASLYLNAGADILHTNTFGASPLRLSFYSLEDKTEQINRNAVLAVRNVVGNRAYVSASCGPSGKFLKPHGDVEPEELYNSFKTQINTLIASGVDIICIETMTDLREAELAIEAAKTVSPSTPLMATMTFNSTSRGFYTMMGISIEDAVQGLEKAGADIIGSNCGSGSEDMVKTAKEFKKLSRLPLIMQPNAGIPVIKDNKPVYPETPEFMAERAKELISSGVSIIGGCCGTTPKHIEAIRKLVDSIH
jgi:5-methyltetrahydrofolate--homocysteine methyltransferase